MSLANLTTAELLAEIGRLRESLSESEETLRAIRQGEIDALVVSGPDGDRLYTLEGATANYRVLVEEMNQGAATLSAEGVILYSNQRFADLVQSPLERVIGTLFTSYVPAGQASSLAALVSLGKVGRTSGEILLRTAGGAEIPVHLALSPLPADTSARLCMVATDLTGQKKKEETLLALMKNLDTSNRRLRREIAERRKAEKEVQKLNEGLERRVRERTAQLEASNRELETFSYSVSHDLRAPLRSINGFCGILLHDFAALLNEEGRSHLQRICQASQHMGRLIDDLLELSRTARADLRRIPLDLSFLAQACLEDLRNAEPARTVDFRITPGLTAWADPVLMRAALENLLGNAWKFTSRRPDAVIEFTAEDRRKEKVFLVRDNGVGFDPAQARKIFGPFQRLHPAGEFAGSGIGLATVQRIIHRHGGQIWAESAPGQGASFFFTLETEASEP